MQPIPPFELIWKRRSNPIKSFDIQYQGVGWRDDGCTIKENVGPGCMEVDQTDPVMQTTRSFHAFVNSSVVLLQHL